MTFLIVLMCVVVAVLLLKPAIKKAPAIWYAAAIALALLYIGVLQGLLPLPAPVRNVLFLLLQRGTLAVALVIRSCANTCLPYGRSFLLSHAC